MNVRPSALIVQDNRILTLHYRYGDRDVFALPGGNPDPGENLNEALVREIDEELGVKASVSQIVCSGEVIWTDPQKETLHMVFEASISEIPALNPEHTTALEICWLPVDQLSDKVLYPNIGPQILDWQHSRQAAFIGPIDQPYLR